MQFSVNKDGQTTMATEFYNIYDLFFEGRIVPDISMDRNLLRVKNNEGVSQLTDGWLSQSKLKNCDFLLLKLK